MDQDESDLKKIEDLIIGSGAKDFRTLESIADVFCPFEAIGMVSQEIRHSHYLAYIMDPNRPHGFGDAMLQGFLELVAEDEGSDLGFSKMDLHLWDGTKATVRREWRNIDLLIELPTPKSKKKGLVVAVELKINAQESDKQLTKYTGIVETEYKGWTQVFVFLTKHNDEASEGNNETWLPLGLEALIDRLKEVAQRHGFSGSSVQLFMAYEAMLRRHHLSNTELEELAGNLWAKHKEALDLLHQYKPDYLGDLMVELRVRQEEIARDLNERLKDAGHEIEIVTDKSHANHLRFSMKSWDGLEGMDAGTKEWLESGRLIGLELCKSGNDLKTSLVIGPSVEDFRADFYQEVREEFKAGEKAFSMGRDTRVIPKKWKHLSTITIKDHKKLTSDEKDGKLVADLVETCIKDFVKHWVNVLPKYDALIRRMHRAKHMAK